NATLRGGSVTPKVTGLSTCDNKVVYFKSGSCSGAQFSTCTLKLADATCTGSAFNAPSTAGSYTYYACLDMNGDGDTIDVGESNSKILSIAASSPTVGSLTFSPSPVDLITGGKKFIKVTATVTNGDGASEISSCSGYLWNTTVTSPYTASKATYTNSSCLRSGCSGTTCQCECGFNLMYYDAPGTWRGNITAKTTSSTNGTNQGTFTVNKNTGVDVANVNGPINSANPTPISFASIMVGDKNVPSSSNPLKVINKGNTKLNVSLYGTDHVGVSNSSWAIKVGNMTYNSTASGMTTLRNLKATPTGFYPTGGIPAYPGQVSGIAEKAAFYIYNYLSIPAGFLAQAYVGSYYLGVEAI
ncbi:MAG TPA: hypothetical protein VJ343_01685, partial [archaeon]|nr:hypothetical protein [archaeon]